jgi:hypothetical protein
VTASFADNEIWHVLIASDDMKRMNVEQLDDAFRLSLVDASTMVWKAGMKTWQSLGAVAGIDDEPELETKVRWIEPPPPPRPMARPAPRPPSPRRLQAPAPARFETTVTPVYAAPLVAPVYTPQLRAPDPYTLPKRRVQIDSEVDFRRASGVHWGRWLFAFLLITGGVLGAYRQNLLREGARRIGVEGKYLYGEKRAVAFVTAKAPAPVQNVLKRLALLPGPNAAPPPAPVTPTQAAAAAPVAAAAVPATPPTKPAEPEVKTVSLDSLPVLMAAPDAAKAASVAAAVAPAPRAKAEPVAKRATASKAATPKAERAEKPEPVAKAEPKPKPKAEPPPPANENPLKAAIRLAIAADVAKAKKK